MRFGPQRFFLSALAALALAAPVSLAGPPAFPGAEGFGAGSIGGRGGDVYLVTSLNDSGSGTLRECVDASGPRTCVFRTGGNIVLSSELDIRNPYITIAGQTAPGGGITLIGEDDNTIRIRTHDVTLRYLRLRHTGIYDALTLRAGAYDVVIDHVSAYWGSDEVMSTYTGSSERVHDVTIQRSILGQGLLPASKGILLGYSDRIGFHHNLVAHNNARSPRCQQGDNEFINNVVYNYGSDIGWCDDKHGDFRVNYIKNYVMTGPDSANGEYLMKADGAGSTIYTEGNLYDEIFADIAGIKRGDAQESSSRLTMSNPYPITETSASEAKDDVLGDVGANKRLAADGTVIFYLDSVDDSILSDIHGPKTLRFVSDPYENPFDPFPAVESGLPHADADSDGMPDAFEDAMGFDKFTPDHNGDHDGDGYTNLEEYLNRVDAVGGGEGPSPPTNLRRTDTASD